MIVGLKKIHLKPAVYSCRVGNEAKRNEETESLGDSPSARRVDVQQRGSFHGQCPAVAFVAACRLLKLTLGKPTAQSVQPTDGRRPDVHSPISRTALIPHQALEFGSNNRNR